MFDIIFDIIGAMGMAEDLKQLESSKNVSFKDLIQIAMRYFGKPRINRSHHIFRTPWKGQPWVNLQKDGRMAKPYQVKQMQRALEKLQEMKSGR